MQAPGKHRSSFELFTWVGYLVSKWLDLTRKLSMPHEECMNSKRIIQIYSLITCGRVVDGELLYTEIIEVNLVALAYRLFHKDFSPIYFNEIFMKQSLGKCK